MTSCERDLQSLYALASSNRSIPSSVSRARKPSPVVLSTLGIGNRNHSTRKKAARIAQILPPIRPSHTPCSPRRPARATVSRTALVPPYVPDITARSALDRVRRSLRSSGSLDEVSISRSSCRPWGRSVPRAPGGPVDLDRHPAGVARDWTNSSAVSGPVSGNRRVPWPTTTGKINRFISSTRSLASSHRIRLPLPCTCSSLSCLAFSSPTAAATSPERTVVSFHRGSVSVVEATYLGREFNASPMGLTLGSAIAPQEPAKIS